MACLSNKVDRFNMTVSGRNCGAPRLSPGSFGFSKHKELHVLLGCDLLRIKVFLATRILSRLVDVSLLPSFAVLIPSFSNDPAVVDPAHDH